ncbi:MAG: type II toxin-antitoxin system VapC family toxin [Solirubrobacterales bacterium]
MAEAETDSAVVDASAFVELLCKTELERPVAERLRDRRLMSPAHFDAEVLSALGRLQRAGELTKQQAEQRIEELADWPFDRRPLAPLLAGAWRRRHNLQLADALYVELAAQLGDVPLVTTDSGMAEWCSSGELVAR